MTNKTKIENALIKALTNVYLVTFGGYKSDYPSKEELASHITEQIGENYLSDNEIVEKTINFINSLPKNLTVKTFPRNLMHYVVLENEFETV
jgi:hypothetical protein